MLFPNDEDHHLALQYIAAGNYPDVALSAVGISRGAYADWLRFARNGLEPYRTFIAAVRKAEAKSEAGMVLQLAKHGMESPSAIQFMAARRFASRWSEATGRQVREEQSKVCARLERLLDPATYEKVMEIMQTPDDDGAVPETDERDEAPKEPRG